MSISDSSYDLFISYAEPDRAWVEGYLLDALKQANTRVLSDVAFALGAPRLVEFERAVKESHRTLLVLSPAYLAERFGEFVDLLAQSYGLETATWPVIPLILHAVELPSRLALLVPLDATVQDTWPAVLARLCAELDRPVPGQLPKPLCPYPGMIPFREEDSPRFFGRTQEVECMVHQLRLHRFLAVIGPSGSGKSSIVFAGLIPALRHSGFFAGGEWDVCSMRPGSSPLVTLRAIIGDLAEFADHPPTTYNFLLIVDQFEELFTHAQSDTDIFEQTLLQLADTPRCYLVLTVRADFYADLMTSLLWSRIQAHRAEVLPLSDNELRHAIVQPAEAVGVFVETALVERLVADAGMEPGFLPFIQETMVLLWEKVERRYLPLRAYDTLILSARSYRELGTMHLTGLQVAMADRAETALQALPPEHHIIARRIFLRLVQFGEGRADTRRQQPVMALSCADDNISALEATLHHLVDHRLLILSGEPDGAERTVDIAHEALITGWPTLKQWLVERRGAEQARRRLEAKADEWVRLGQGEGGLLDQVEMLEAERWMCSPDARELGMSHSLRELHSASQEEERRRAEQKKRTARFRRIAWGTIIGLIFVALSIGLVSARQIIVQEQAAAATAESYAVVQITLAAEAQSQANARATEVAIRSTAEAYARAAQRTAASEADARATEVVIRSTAEAIAIVERELADAQRKEAERQAALALARQLAAQSLTYSTYDLDLALLLSRAANQIVDRTEVKGNLLSVLQSSPHLTTFLHGHSASVRSVAFHPGGQLLVSVGDDGQIILWDIAKKQVVHQSFVDRNAAIKAVAFSPDGRYFASGDEDGIVVLWDTAKGEIVGEPLTGHTGAVNAVAFHPEGNVLASGSQDNSIILWDILRGRSIDLPLTGHTAPVWDVTFSPDGGTIASGGEDGVLMWWDVATGESIGETFARDTETICGIDFSPDGTRLVVGKGREVILLDAATHQPIGEPMNAHSGYVFSVAFDADGRKIASASMDKSLIVWDAENREPISQPFIGHTGWIWDAEFSPGGNTIASGSSDGSIILWDTSVSQPLADFSHGHEGAVVSVAFSPDGQTLASGGVDNTIIVWNVASHLPSGEPLTGHTGAVWNLAFSPDGKLLASASLDKTIILWDPKTGQVLSHPMSAHDSEVLSLSFSPDSKTLASGGQDGTIILWDTVTQQPLGAPLKGETGAITSLAFNQAGTMLASASDSGNVTLWDVETRQPDSPPLDRHLAAVWDIAFSPQGDTLASASDDQTIIIWDVVKRQPVGLPLTKHLQAVFGVAFSPDGTLLASCSFDNTIILWEAVSHQPFGQPLTGHTGLVLSVAFSPDGSTLASGSVDGTVAIWDLDLDFWLARACDIANRNMTQDEWDQFVGESMPYTCTCPALPAGNGVPLTKCPTTP